LYHTASLGRKRSARLTQAPRRSHQHAHRLVSGSLVQAGPQHVYLPFTYLRWCGALDDAADQGGVLTDATIVSLLGYQRALRLEVGSPLRLPVPLIPQSPRLQCLPPLSCWTRTQSCVCKVDRRVQVSSRRRASGLGVLPLPTNPPGPTPT
jgi:hypothetical protein